MKLPLATLTTAQKLEEFDVWITPYLGDIRQTRQFTNTLNAIVRAFDRLCEATRDFANEADITHGRLADSLVTLFKGKARADVLRILLDLTSVLFLITGKSDNNAKCQFPLFLKNELKKETLPKGKTRTTRATRRKPAAKVHGIEQIPTPRILESDKYMRLTAGLDNHPNEQREMIDIFLCFVLDDEAYLKQLWSLGKSYAMLRTFGRSESLLSPLVVAQVRGSVAATSGHEPEKILRQLMAEWGLTEGTDFNAADVKLNAELHIAREVRQGGKKVKTRAYDFALPYKVDGWGRKVLIQSQYYAGDSGSVSHKNVDQTTAARREAKKTVGVGARFVEYVDGAGFFASLNGDLKSLLDMADTSSFIQLRSTPIRLRRELQHAGFLTPIEIEHAILLAGNELTAVTAVLQREGYAAAEINRAIRNGVTLGLLDQPDADHIGVASGRRAQARRYLLLDLAAVHGKTLTKAESALAGHILLPGYGPFHGIKTDELRSTALRTAPTLRPDWKDAEEYRADLGWLALRGYAIVNP